MTAPGDALRAYLPHGRTPHGRPIDWAAAPARHKTYPGARRTVLPWEDLRRDTLGAFLAALSGLTRVRWAHPVDQFGNRVDGTARAVPGRSVPSGGGLYPLEIYVATGKMLGHYDSAHHALEELRGGDHRPALLDSPVAADTVVVVTDRFWRNAFKYREFGYRLQNQEVGVVAAQALAAAEQLSLPARVQLLFDDERVNALLGLTTLAESAMAIISLGEERPVTGQPHHELVAKPIRTSSPVPKSIDEELPHLSQLHVATMAAQTTAVEDWPAPPSHPTPTKGRVVLPRVDIRPMDGLDERKSPPTGFLPGDVDLRALSGILTAAAASWNNDLPGVDPSIALYVITSRVADLAPAAHLYQKAQHCVDRIGSKAVASLLENGQETMATGLPLSEAAFVLIPVGRPLAGIRAFGDRWYRIMQAEVGVALQRGALAAAALGLTARIHSGDAPDFTSALGVSDEAEALSALVVGRPKATVDHRIGRIG